MENIFVQTFCVKQTVQFPTNMLKRLIISKKLLIILLVSLLSSLFIFLKVKPNKEFPLSTNLVVTSISPSQSTYKSIWSTDPVLITFDQPIKKDSIFYSVEPNSQTRLIFNENKSNQFEILPINGWKHDVKYIIIISKEITSVSGARLDKDLIIEFTRLVPSPSDPEYPITIEEENY